MIPKTQNQVCYFFYKNFMFGLPQFWFAIYWNAFSAQVPLYPQNNR